MPQICFVNSDYGATQDFLIKMQIDVPPSAWVSQKHDSPHPYSVRVHGLGYSVS
jgi:hypothetical protein